MSLQTIELQAAARYAEQEWHRHKGGCIYCGSRDRNVEPCPAGHKLRRTAQAAREAARKSAKLDKGPSENDIPLFEISEIASPQVREVRKS